MNKIQFFALLGLASLNAFAMEKAIEETIHNESNYFDEIRCSWGNSGFVPLVSMRHIPTNQHIIGSLTYGTNQATVEIYRKDHKVKHMQGTPEAGLIYNLLCDASAIETSATKKKALLGQLHEILKS